MKLTKSTLKQLIKEEIEYLNESPFKLLDELHKGLLVLGDGLDDLNNRVAELEKEISNENN